MSEENTPPPSFRPSVPRTRPGMEGARSAGEPSAPPPSFQPSVPRRSVMPDEPVEPPARTAPPAPSVRPASPVRSAGAIPPPSRAPRPAAPAAEFDDDAPPSIAPGSGVRSPKPRRTAPAPAPEVPPAQRYTEPVPRPAGQPRGTTTRRRRKRRWAAPVAMLIALLLAWPVGLLVWANGRIAHVPALSGAPDTPGTTYLLVGSDSRADGAVADDGEGQRTDTLLILHRAPNGQTALVSLPRDTYVEIPGYGPAKLNAAYAWGGPQLVVQTVEGLTGLTIDHYVEVGMGGVVNIVDAVGGVELCLDYDVNDPFSGLVWTAGCHMSDGSTALAFARMRKEDPLGDFGRQARQRQVIAAIISAAATPSTLVNPFRQVELVRAGTDSLVVSEGTSILDLGRSGLAFRAAIGEGGLMGTPPVANPDYQPGGVGSTVLLDEARAADFFARLTVGELTPEDFLP